MFAFDASQLQFLAAITVGMVVVLALVNAFAIVASEGSHLLKLTFYLSLLLFISGLSFLVVPSMVTRIL
jgi:archaellum biogenesis protein FlaJ (TadC family)